jgi:hypothetical protein
MFFATALRRALWLACTCAVLVAPRAAAAERLVAADFDGDGRSDRVAIDRKEPSVLHVWLSSTGTTDVIRNARPLLRVVAADLDGDHRPELIATDTSATGLRIWKRDTRRGFSAYRARHSVPRPTGPSSGKTAEDDPDDPAEDLPESQRLPASLDRGLVPVGVTQSLILAAQPNRAPASTTWFVPSAPRPPPAVLA